MVRKPSGGSERVLKGFAPGAGRPGGPAAPECACMRPEATASGYRGLLNEGMRRIRGGPASPCVVASPAPRRLGPLCVPARRRCPGVWVPIMRPCNRSAGAKAWTGQQVGAARVSATRAQSAPLGTSLRRPTPWSLPCVSPSASLQTGFARGGGAPHRGASGHMPPRTSRPYAAALLNALVPGLNGTSATACALSAPAD